MEPGKLQLSRILEILILLISLALVGFLATLAFQRSRVRRMNLAAGSSTGESYIIGAALKTVVERHYPKIKITLLETGGTVENLRLLEQGRAGLAIAQADVPAGPSARLVAVLYDDTFQLLVSDQSPIHSFSDLKGKAIALPRTGGQFQSFLLVADHFGLHESDFRFVGDTDVSGDQALSDGRADAMFRVRALGNPSIEHLVQTGKFRLARIDHAAAMKINHPAFAPSVIPAGAYLGNPAVPAEDLPSISVHRTLLGAVGVDDETIRAVTQTLVDMRQEIAQEIPQQVADVRLLLAQVRRPELQNEFGPALHPGALEFYEKDKPPFILAHADYMGLLLTVLVMVGSWILQLRAWMERQQKSAADVYSNRVVALMTRSREAGSQEALEKIRGELLGILAAAVSDLDADKLSEESFNSFRAILQIGLEAVRDSRMALESACR